MEEGLFAQLVLWLFDQHPKPGEVREGGAAEIFEKLSTIYIPFVDRRQLEQCLPGRGRRGGNFLGQNRYLYLEPIARQGFLLPIVTIESNFERDTPEVRIRLGLFLLDGREIRTLGLRFETPEGNGRHNYYHAQFITGFGGGALVHGCPDWLPTSEPTFAIDAGDTVHLLMCVLVSLYGLDYLDRLESALGGVLRSYSKHMHASKFGPSFWQVRPRAGGLHYYENWATESEFKAKMVVDHGQCRISRSGRDTYLAQPSAQRRKFERMSVPASLDRAMANVRSTRRSR